MIGLTVLEMIKILLEYSCFCSQHKLKKVGKTTRPFRYELNQIPYDYTVEVRNRFKGLDLKIKCLKNYGWRFVTLYKDRDQDHPHGKEMQKKQNGCLGRPNK